MKIIGEQLVLADIHTQNISDHFLNNREFNEVNRRHPPKNILATVDDSHVQTAVCNREQESQITDHVLGLGFTCFIMSGQTFIRVQRRVVDCQISLAGIWILAQTADNAIQLPVIVQAWAIRAAPGYTIVREVGRAGEYSGKETDVIAA